MCSDRRTMPPIASQRGLSLVEIMVGVVIAMIGIVVIFQMLAVAEERKRTASSGSDVQVTGVIAMSNLERDLREAGYGFASAGFDAGVTPVMGCTVDAYDSGRPVAVFSFRLTPIQIVQGAGAASDTIVVLRGNSSTFGASLVFTESTNTSKRTRGRAGLNPRDYVIIGRSTPSLQCMLAELTNTSNPDGLTVNHALGPYSYTVFLTNGTTQTLTRTARFNNPAPGLSFTNGFLFNLGNGARRNIWTVQNGRLQFSNDLLYVDGDGDGANDVTEVADNIVSLQAQYGIDADNNGRITSGEWTTTDPVTAAGWANILAVRVGLLVRSPQFERAAVTTVVPTWSGGSFVITNLDGSASGTTPADPANNWRNYRYRVYENVIPLRNMLWGTRISP